MPNLYFILEVSIAPKFPAQPAIFCSARPGINILQNLYIGLNIFCGERRKLIKILLSMGIICELLSVQLLACGILKTKYDF